MREASRLLAMAAIGLTVSIVSPVSVTPVSAQSERAPGGAGHAIAEKFSAEAERPAKEAAAKREAERKAEEAEMLVTAKAEAEARREALEKARATALLAEQRRVAEEKRIAEEKSAAEARRVAEAKAAEDARKAAETARIAEQKAAEARRIADLKAGDEQRRAEEEKVVAAKAAAERRIAEEKALEEQRQKAETARLVKQKQDEARRIADVKRAEENRRQAEAETQAQQAKAQALAMAAEREAEAQRVAERLREAHARRGNANQTASAPQPIEPPAGLGGPASPPLPTSQPWDVWTTPPHANRSAQLGATRVTVLLLMEPGNRGIRRHNKTADPLLCNGGGCFVSNGPDAAATFMPGRRALSAGRTFGERAGACSNSLGCVFRDVELGVLPVSVQPIDMRVMHHDRREARTIDTPADCRALSGRLMCRRTIQSSDYSMWVVPEDLARSAGPAALERALAEGLPDSEQAALPNPWRR